MPERKIQRHPSSDRMLLTSAPNAERSHERKGTTNVAKVHRSNTTPVKVELFLIGFQVIDVEDVQLESAGDKSYGIDSDAFF